jgi:hypothetical protein
MISEVECSISNLLIVCNLNSSFSTLDSKMRIFDIQWNLN